MRIPDAEDSSSSREHAESTKLFTRLTGKKQEWLVACRNYVTDPSLTSAEAIRDDSVSAAALRNNSDTTAPAASGLAVLDSPLESRHWSTARRVRSLAYALGAQGSLLESREDLATHLAGHGLSSVSEAGRGQSVILVDLVESLLRGDLPQDCAHAALPILIAGEHHEGGEVRIGGNSGTLRLRRLSSGPPGLHPDPTMMLFSKCDKPFVDALATAWETSQFSATSTECIVWSVAAQSDGSPLLNIEGGSFGATLGVLLDDLSRTGWRRRYARHLLDPKAAITATLAPTGHLGEVERYDEKLDAAWRHRLRVIIAKEGMQAALRAPAAQAVKPQFVETLPQAIRQVRRTRNPALTTALVAGAFLLLTTAAGGFWAQQQRIGAAADRLAVSGQQLANSAPQRAAQYAISAHQLRTSSATARAIGAVLDNNNFVIASRDLGDNAIETAALTPDVALIADGSREIRVLALPTLHDIGKLTMSHPNPVVASCANGQFAVADGDQLRLYQTPNGQPSEYLSPIRQPGIPIRSGAGIPRESVVGLYCDSAGGVLTLASNLTFSYYSPKTAVAVSGDLKDTYNFKSLETIHIIDATGFGANTEDIGDGVSFNMATRQEFAFATSDGRVWRLHLSSNPNESGSKFWASLVTERSQLVSVGWVDQDLMLGTARGLEPAVTQVAAAPVIAGRTTSIRRAPYGGTSGIITARGVSFLTRYGSIDLNNNSRDTASFERVTVLEPTFASEDMLDDSWILGRDDGIVQLLHPTPKAAWTDWSSTETVVKPITDDLLVATSGPVMDALGVSVYSRAGKELESFRLPTAVQGGAYINDVTGTRNWIGAAGTTRDKRGFVAIWNRRDQTSRVIYFSRDFSREAEPDIVADLSINPSAGTVTARNPFRDEVATWRLLDGSEVGRSTTQNPGVGRLTASSDGSIIAIQDGTRVELISTATHSSMTTFDVGGTPGDLSPDGREFAQGNGNSISIIDVSTLKRKKVSGVPFEVNRVDLSMDGKRIVASALGSGDVAVVDLDQERVVSVGKMTVTEEQVAAIAWLDTRTILVQTALHQARNFTPSRTLIFAVEDERPLERLCPVAGVPMTPREWSEVVGWGIPQPAWPCKQQ